MRALIGMTMVLLLAGCGSASRHGDDPAVRNIVFPDPGSAGMKGGTFPNLDNLRQVGVGQSKEQLYDLLGPPHFHEGVFGVHEWNYLFNFRVNDGIVRCQYQVLFDHERHVDQTYWKPRECADVLRRAPPMAATAVPEPLPAEPLRLSADSLFAFDSYELTGDGRHSIDGVLSQVREASQVQRIQVTGYTDRIGGDAYNMTLSKQRAEAVRAYMVSAGIADERIVAEGRGKADPRVNCDDRSRAVLIACLAPNRRVEIAGSTVP